MAVTTTKTNPNNNKNLPTLLLPFIIALAILLTLYSHQRYANDARSDAALYLNLMDGGVKLAKEVGLELGKAPTAAEIARAKEDFVWLVEENIQGHRVLVPKVFLAKNYNRANGGYIHAKDGIDLNVAGELFNSGTIKSDGSMQMSVGSFSNEWGSIEAKRDISINSIYDIANLSGTIKAKGKLSLLTQRGSIYNITQSAHNSFSSKNSSYLETIVGKEALLSGASVELNAARDILNIGATITSASSIGLLAGGDIGIYTLAIENSRESNFKDGFNKNQTIKNLQSKLNAKAALNLKANNITLEAAKLKGSSVTLDAKESIESLAAYNKEYQESQVNHKKLLGVEGESSTNLEQTVLSTTIDTNSLRLKADKNIHLQATKANTKDLNIQTKHLTLESLNNISYHSFTKSTNGLLTNTTREKGSHKEDIVATTINTNGVVTLNGKDISSELIKGKILSSQSPQKELAKAKEQINKSLQAAALNYLNNLTKQTTTNKVTTNTNTSPLIKRVQTKAINKSWDKKTTHLNALGQLVVQVVVATATSGSGNALLAGVGIKSNTALAAAIDSVVNQVSQDILTAAITGEPIDIDITNLAKGALAAGALDYTNNFLNKKLALPKNASFAKEATSMLAHSSTKAAITTALYGGSYKDALINNITNSLTNRAYQIVGNVAMQEELGNHNQSFKDGGVGKTVLHATVGGVSSLAKGGSFLTGAAAAGARELLSPLSANTNQKTQDAIAQLGSKRDW